MHGKKDSGYERWLCRRIRLMVIKKSLPVWISGHRWSTYDLVLGRLRGVAGMLRAG